MHSVFTNSRKTNNLRVAVVNSLIKAAAERKGFTLTMTSEVPQVHLVSSTNNPEI